MLDIAVRQRGALRETDHRPWPLPKGRWLVAQTWEDVVFAHWRAAPDAVQALLPAGLEADVHDGSAWVGANAFRVECVRLHGALPVPWVSSFPQLNVRTYVRAGKRPGLWFFSLDTPSLLAAETARRVYRLPWRTCRLEMRAPSNRIEVTATRAAGRAFVASLSPRGAAAEAEPGGIEHFLLERYCLYARDRGRLHRADLHHRPWRVQTALGGVDLNTIAPAGLEPGEEQPLLHVARVQDTLAWPLERV
jgi:uncharacterized protein YqjF (DUF2071 family)